MALFILAFVVVAALFTSVPALAPLSYPILLIGQRALALALFLIGLSLARGALAKALRIRRRQSSCSWVVAARTPCWICAAATTRQGLIRE